MKKFITLALGLIFIFALFTIGAAAQTRDGRKKYRGLPTNIAIIGGSTAAGALIGRGRNGAMIGAGAGTIYAMSRKGSKNRYSDGTRRVGKVVGGTVLGTGIGAAVGGKKGMIIGSLIGAGGSYLYTKKN